MFSKPKRKFRFLSPILELSFYIVLFLHPAWLWIPGMVSQPCELLTLEPTRVVETLKNLTTRFRDYRVVEVVNLLSTANDGTMMHLYTQLLNLLDVIIDYAESKQVPAPEELHVQISTTEKRERLFLSG
ncbi:unnamed protein product [Lactuca saligna]|uniref:Uncharacterized protein n=1 Tax=Lactuca saligna TaxID=75948 RepID=A0AA35VE32_LACSI|nr:unnamed protein product [Lactuca saligna]